MNPFTPSPFTYGDSPQGSQIAPLTVTGRNPSNTIDKQYQAGTFWLSSLDQYTLNPSNQRVYGSGNLYYQAGNSAGTPNWVLVSDASGPIVGIAGTANQITATNNAGTVTLSTPATFIAPGSIAATTTLTATLGNITATNGNLVLGTAGNKIISTSVGTTTAAGANSFGSVTLVGGTATIATTAVTANSLIKLSRQSIGATGAAALGQLTVGTISAGTSFVINAALTATATSLATTDVSVVNWEIVN